MTRINVIPPAELHNKHLAAERYELPEIFMLVRRQQAKGNGPGDLMIPETYRYGEGHKTFFYDKLSFLAWRYTALTSEMINRGYNVKVQPDFATTYSDLFTWWWNGWDPPPDAIALNRVRLAESLARINARKAGNS